MELTAVEFWSRIQEAARNSIPDHAYTSWIAGVKATALSADELLLEASNRFKAEWLEDKYRELLEAKAAEILGRPFRVSVSGAVSPDPFSAPPVRLEAPQPASGRGGLVDSG